MNNKVSKNTKPIILKAVVVAMTICCIFGPFRSEIHKVLHTIVHSLETPDYVLSHSSTSSKDKVHIVHEHKKEEANHNHDFIKLVAKVFEVTEQENSANEPMLVFYMLDKHLKIHETTPKEKIIIPVINPIFSVTQKKICKGYLKDINKPPEVYRNLIFS